MKKKKKNKEYIYTILAILIALIYLLYNNSINQTYSLNTTNNTNNLNNNQELLKISFIDVGQADSILIENDNKNMLIDAGNNEDGDKLVKYFKEHNIDSFEYLVGTHPHEDHIGGLDNIINNFNIKNIYMPEVITTTKTFEDVLKAIDNKNLSITVPKINDTLKLGNATLKVIYTGNDEKDLNNSSIVLKLTYYNNTFLFTGDATSKVEQLIIDKDIQSDVLKIGHHGSKYSSTLDFLKKVNPKYAIISVGKNNSYNHPSDSTISKLTKLNIPIYRTDKLGTIIVTSNGKDIKINNIKTDTNGE